jgi:serine/tyrosine/threonine adenylyltransferase
VVAHQGLPADPEQLGPFVAAAPAPGGEGAVADTLQRWNLAEVPIRPVIERIWAAIEGRDDWQPLRHWLDAAGTR